MRKNWKFVLMNAGKSRWGCSVLLDLRQVHDGRQGLPGRDVVVQDLGHGGQDGQRHAVLAGQPDHHCGR